MSEQGTSVETTKLPEAIITSLQSRAKILRDSFPPLIATLRCCIMSHIIAQASYSCASSFNSFAGHIQFLVHLTSRSSEIRAKKRFVSASPVGGKDLPFAFGTLTKTMYGSNIIINVAL